jgi:3-oxoacyl-[acyl-carrier-protein] synthase-3
MGTKITGVGMYVPPRVLTNADLERMVDTSDQWILDRTGIRERHIAEAGTATSDLAAEAARRALADAGRTAEDVDLIILGTLSPDMPFPSTACFVQQKIGALNAYAMDVEAACSGFIYALSVADALIRVGRGKIALVIGAEIVTSVVDYSDRTTCVLFGDGAGAAVVEPCPDGEGVLSCHLHSDGNNWHFIQAPVGGTVTPFIEGEPLMGKTLRMAGNETFRYAVTRMGEVCTEALEAAGLAVADVDLVVAHQANQRIVSAVGKRLGVDPAKVYLNVDRFGNTSAATIPICLAELKEQGRLAPGTVVLLVAFGAGITWGAALLRM